MSGIISDKAFNDVFTATRGDMVMQALVTAVYELGCLAGAMFALFFGDSTGRRWMIFSGAIVMIIGVVIQVTSFVDHIPLLQFFIGRVITGIGNGMNTSTIPTYQAECSKTSNRGLLICIEGGVIAIGTMIAYWIDFGAHYGPPDLVWRFPIAFQVVFGIIIIVGMFFLPDSPRFLISKGRVEEGEYVLAALGGYEVHDHETQVQKNLVIDSLKAYVSFLLCQRQSAWLTMQQFWRRRQDPLPRPLHRWSLPALPPHACRFLVPDLPAAVWLQRCHLLPARAA